MCCLSTQKGVDRILKKFKKSKYPYIICYKVVKKTWVSLDRYMITGPVYPYEQNKGYQIGINVSTSKARKLPRVGAIDRGIHVYDNINTAKGETFNFYSVMSIRCYKKDFIGAANNYIAVFKQVELTKRSYDKTYKQLEITNFEVHQK